MQKHNFEPSELCTCHCQRGWKGKLRLAAYALIGGTPEELQLAETQVSRIEEAVEDIVRGRSG